VCGISGAPLVVRTHTRNDGSWLADQWMSVDTHRYVNEFILPLQSRLEVVAESESMSA